MTDLVCDKCGSYYELEDGENPDEYLLECDCGGNLEYIDKIPTKNNVVEEKRGKILRGKSLTDSRSFFYKIFIISGLLVFLFGIAVLIIMEEQFIGYFFAIGGLFLAYTGYKGGYSWIRGAKGEKEVSEFLESLPSGYFILNDVKIPLGRGNYDHVLVGPTGIFLIETKNYSANIDIYGDKWINSTYRRKMRKTPAYQVKRNAIDLTKLLRSKIIIKGGIFVHPIVALVNPQFTIKKPPSDYYIKHSAEVNDFIVNFREKIDGKTIMRVVNFLQQFSNEILYRKEDIEN